MMYRFEKLQSTYAHILVWVLVLWLVPFSALGFFSSSQTAPEQSFAAGSLTLLPVTPQSSNVTVTPSDVVSTTFTIETGAGSIPAQYDLVVTNTNGPNSFCQELKATLESPEGSVGGGPVDTLASGPQSTEGQWDITFSTEYDSVAGEGSVCTIDILVDAWNEQVGKGGGFVDDTTFSIAVQFALSQDTGDNDDANNSNENNNGAAGESSADPAPIVIINELNWAGSAASGFDQWIELYNPGTEPVDVSGWHLLNARSANGTSTLPADSVIPGGGYYLIARYASGHTNSAFSSSIDVDFVDTISLANNYITNGAVILQRPDGTIIDQTPEPTSGTWPAGNNQTGDSLQKWSMQRGENPGDGGDPGNWYTCDPTVLNKDGTLGIMQSYWLVEYATSSCGTPRHENLSSNDPTIGSYNSNDFSPDKKSDSGDPAMQEKEGEPKNRDEKDVDTNTPKTPDSIEGEHTTGDGNSSDEVAVAEKSETSKKDEEETPGPDGDTTPKGDGRLEDINRNENEVHTDTDGKTDAVSGGSVDDDEDKAQDTDEKTGVGADEDMNDGSGSSDVPVIDEGGTGESEPTFAGTDTSSEDIAE